MVLYAVHKYFDKVTEAEGLEPPTLSGDCFRNSVLIQPGYFHELVRLKKEAEGLEPPIPLGPLFSRQHPHPAGLLPSCRRRGLSPHKLLLFVGGLVVSFCDM